MWIKEILLCFIGLTSGLAVSAGVFAFAVTIGLVPRFVGKSHTSQYVLIYEHMILLGGIFGTLVSLFALKVPFGTPILIVFGLCAGIYNGCLAVALAEILDAFPIMFRRTGMKVGQNWVIIAMALGKTVGALYYYATHIAK